MAEASAAAAPAAEQASSSSDDAAVPVELSFLKLRAVAERERDRQSFSTEKPSIPLVTIEGQLLRLEHFMSTQGKELQLDLELTCDKEHTLGGGASKPKAPPSRPPRPVDVGSVADVKQATVADLQLGAWEMGSGKWFGRQRSPEDFHFFVNCITRPDRASFYEKTLPNGIVLHSEIKMFVSQKKLELVELKANLQISQSGGGVELGASFKATEHLQKVTCNTHGVWILPVDGHLIIVKVVWKYDPQKVAVDLVEVHDLFDVQMEPGKSYFVTATPAEVSKNGPMANVVPKQFKPGLQSK